MTPQTASALRYLTEQLRDVLYRWRTRKLRARAIRIPCARIVIREVNRRAD